MILYLLSDDPHPGYIYHVVIVWFLLLFMKIFIHSFMVIPHIIDHFVTPIFRDPFCMKLEHNEGLLIYAGKKKLFH